MEKKEYIYDRDLIITGRGQVVVFDFEKNGVLNSRSKNPLMGSEILFKGKPHKIIGIESWLNEFDLDKYTNQVGILLKKI